MPLILILLLLAGPATLLAQEAPERSTVTVSAVGTVEREPDQAVAVLAIESFAGSARDAAAENARRTDAVLEALDRLGIPDADIRTIGYSLDPEYDRRPDRPREPGEDRVIGYRARNMLEVTVDELDRVGQVIDAAIEAGADRVGGIRFQLRDPDAARRDALRQAVDNARAEAEAIAGALGRRLGPALAVTTARFGPPQPLMLAEEAMVRAAPPPTPIEPGTLEVSATVTVVYQLEPPR